MTAIKFTKIQGSGNDFVVIDGFRASDFGLRSLAKRICERKYGVGADGVLFLEKTKNAKVRMRIFNADGSQAQMCGNGARCAALWAKSNIKYQKSKMIMIETRAGIIEAEVKGDLVRLKLTDPTDLKLDIKLHVHGKEYEADYVNTGVPHAVIEVEDLDKIPVKQIGRLIRHHKVFKPAGTNVDFIKVRGNGSVLVRTYERGVEDETLACGTGSVAAAIIATLNHAQRQNRCGQVVSVVTKSGEVLKVYFKASRRKISDVWLEGKAMIVFEGVYHV